MKHIRKRTLGILLTLVMLFSLVPGMSLTAHAVSEIYGDTITVFDSDSGTLSNDMTCTRFDVFGSATLTISQGVTLTLNCSDYMFELTDDSKLELHGILTGSVSNGEWSWISYINVYLSDGAKYTVTGLSCSDGDNYLRYYGYDAATDGNGTVSVKNGDADVTSSSVGYKTTTYTFTATPNDGYKFKNWTKGPGGEVLGTDASINVTCEQNGQYQVYANFEEAGIAATASGFTGAYDGDPHGISVTVTMPESGATVKYGRTAGTYDLDASPTITNVSESPLTVYYQVTAEGYDPATGSATVTISKADQTAPAAPTQDSVSATSVTLTAIENGEYSKDGTNWQESPTFTGLTKNTEYTFYQRLAGDDNHNASPASAGATISTSNHAHSWSYEASGATITATCANTDGGHDGETTATLTIAAPALTTYGGTESAEATVTGSIDGVEAPAIVYRKGAEALTAAPTDAGSYTAGITVGGATASVEYTIAKADPTYTAPTGLTATYGDTLSAVTLPDGWAWADSTQSVGNVGSNSFKASFTPADTANYNTVENIDVTVTVGKADPSYTAPSGLAATYGQTLADVSLPEGWAWADSTQSVGNVGPNSFPATFTPADTANCNTASVDLTVTVGKATVSVTAEAKSKTYGESDPALTYTVTGLIGGDTLSGALSREPGDAVGVYAITQGTLTAGDNYTISFTGANLTVNKASITPSVSLDGWTYGETAKTPGVSGNTDNGAVTYTYAAKGGTDFSDAVPSAAGEYTVKAAVAPTDNYLGGEATADFTIAKAEITITADDKSSQYGAEPAELSFTVGGAYVSGDELGVTVTTTAGKTADVGEYPIQVSWNENPNYNATLVNGKYTITRTDLAVTAADYSGVYDGAAHGITVDVGSSDAVVYYGETALTADTYSTAGSTAALTYTDAGEYTVYFYVISKNYAPDTVSGSKTVTISKATGTAGEGQTPSANALTYTGEAQPLVTAPSALPDGYTKVQYSVDNGTTWTDTVPTGTDAGETSVSVKYVGDGNHNDFTGDPIRVTIGKATGTAGEGQKPSANTGLAANGEEQALVTAPASLPDGYTKLQYSVDGGAVWTDSVPTGKEAGDYTVSVKYVGDDNHADFAGEDISVTIKAVYTVKFNMNGADEMDSQSVVDGETAAKPADPTRDGYTFDGWYQDATFAKAFAFDTPITADVTVYAKWTAIGYSITNISGATTDASHTWTKGTTTDVVITVKPVAGEDHSFAHFTGVQIDGRTLTPDADFTAHEGSTVVTLKAATLEKRTVGVHTVTITFDNGSVETKLTIKAAPASPSPKTGDTGLPALWACLMAASAIGIGGLILPENKRRKVGTKE